MNENRSIVVVGLAVSLLMVCAVGWFSHQAWQSVVSSSAAVSRTYEVEREAERVLSDVKDIVMGQRGFLLTEREFYLTPYEIGRERVQSDISRLRALTQDNVAQRESLSRLRALIDQRLELVEQTVELAGSGRRDEAIALLATDRGEKIGDEIRAAGQQIKDEEDRLLALRRAQLDRDMHRNRWAAVIITAVHLLFLAAVAFLFWRLTKMQAYLRVCAWSKTVEYEGQWITFEEYLGRRFHIDVSHGLNPEQAQKSWRRRATSRARDRFGSPYSFTSGPSPEPSSSVA